MAEDVKPDFRCMAFINEDKVSAGLEIICASVLSKTANQNQTSNKKCLEYIVFRRLDASKPCQEAIAQRQLIPNTNTAAASESFKLFYSSMLSILNHIMS